MLYFFDIFILGFLVENDCNLQFAFCDLRLEVTEAGGGVGERRVKWSRVRGLSADS